MQYGITRQVREIREGGLEYEKGSVYNRLCQITDTRKAKGKRYRLETLLMIIVMAKLSGEDTPMEIAEWAKHRQKEIERRVGEYNQGGEHGRVDALDGKALRGTRKKDEEGGEYMLSVYAVEQAKVLSQVEVGRKENEITKAPKALQPVEISHKVVTVDARHTQKALAAQIVSQDGDYVFPVKENQASLYKNIQQLFAPEYPKPGFGKIQTDFLTAQKVNQGHGRSETRGITSSEMLNPYSSWPRSIVCNVNSNGGAVDAAIVLLMKSNLA